MKERIKNYFLSGLVFLVPLAVTAFLVIFIINRIGGLWKQIFAAVPYLSSLPIIVINIIGLLVSFLLIVFIGFLGSHIVGRYIFSIPGRILRKTPIVKNIFNSAKELTETLFIDKSSFSKVVIVEFLHPGQYTVAFLTSEHKWKIDGKEAITVFIPTSPNPTGGFFAIIPADEAHETDLSVEEGLKLIVSSGMVFNRKGEINAIKHRKTT